MDMIRVSAPNTTRTFTSGQSYDPTFNIDIQGDISEYERLRIEGDLKDYTDEDMANDINNVLAISYISRAEDLPCTVFLPDTSRVQPAFEVHRGPLHPQEIELFRVELTVYGGDGDNWERLGSDTMELRG